MTVHQMWEEFKRDVLLGDYSKEQVSQLRGAFFAGNWAMFTAIANMGNTSTDDEAERIIDAWHDELVRFGKSLTAESN